MFQGKMIIKLKSLIDQLQEINQVSLTNEENTMTSSLKVTQLSVCHLTLQISCNPK